MEAEATADPERRIEPVPQLISDAYAYNSGYVYPPLYRERSYVDACGNGNALGRRFDAGV